MSTFNCKVHKAMNGFDFYVYDVDLQNPAELTKLEDYIKRRIRTMKVHQKSEDLRAYLQVPGISVEYINAVQKRIEEISRPRTHSLPWFDVRRSRVTEFMSQLLLEKEFQCIFHDEADKRINCTIVNVDKHTPGIDVTGMQHTGSGLRFVVCEVKASKDARIPCSSSTELLSDIEKGFQNYEERLSRELLNYSNSLLQAATSDSLVSAVVDFILSLVARSSSQQELLKNVVFFPFLVRNNAKIVTDRNLDDFAAFNSAELRNADLKGIIWAFNKDIDSFCNEIYDEVVANG